MPDSPSLDDTMWCGYRGRSVALVTPRCGQSVPNGLAAIDFVLSRPDLRIDPVYAVSPHPIAFSHAGLIVIASISELSSDLVRFLRASSYPRRYIWPIEGAGNAIRDTHSGAEYSADPEMDEHYGLVFSARSADFAARAATFIVGTSHLAVRAACLWVNQPSMSIYGSPTNYPDEPLEALIRVTGIGTRELELSDIETMGCSCGDTEFNTSTKQWLPVVHLVPVKIVLHNGKPAEILIGHQKCRIQITSAVFSQLLLLLAVRTRAGMSTTIAYAQKHLFGNDPNDHTRNIQNQKSKIEALVNGSKFVVVDKSSQGSEPGYMLHAVVSYIESGL